MLEVKNIQMSYGADDVLKKINYRFKTGSVYGLIGKNGAGKTTLLKVIMRLISKNKGSVFINGECMDSIDFLRIPAIFVMDSPVFYSDLTVKEQLLLVCRAEGMKKEEAMNKINMLLDELIMMKYKDHFPNALSKGTLQRLNVALGMVRKESIILMDEPFNALDPVQISAVEKIILKSKEEGKTLLISSHDIDSLESICDVYLILRNGELLEYMPDKLTKESITQIIGDSYGD